MDYVGWVWVPGTVWAPAWVVWRHSDVNIGWAPMLAGYDLWFGWAYYPIYYSHWTFTRWRYFCDPHPHHHYLGRKAIAKTFRHTYYPRRCRDSASASCHRGPSKRLVKKRTNLPVKSYKIENMASKGAILSGKKAKKLGVGGDVLKMYRPKFKNAKTKAKARSAFKVRQRKVKDFGIVQDKVRTYSSGKSSKSPNKFYPSSSTSATSGHSKGVRRPSPGREIYPRQPKAKQPSIPKSSVHYPGSRTNKFKGSKFKAPSVRTKSPKRSFTMPKSKSRPSYKPSSKSPKSRSTPSYKPSKSKSSSKSKSNSSFRSSGKRSSSSSSKSKSSGSKSSRGSRRGRR